MPEILVVCGYNASGKSTVAKEYVSRGYKRINRDTVGGRLDDLIPLVEEAVRAGDSVILDNTYADEASRQPVILAGNRLKVPVHCKVMGTTFEQAQFNACRRMIQKVGRLLEPDEMQKTKDPNLFPPAALFAYRSRYKKPTTAEGFSSVQELPFRLDLGPEYKHAALIFDYDDTLRQSTGKLKFPTCREEVKVDPKRAHRVKDQLCKNSYKFLLGISNQSGIGKGDVSYEDAVACFEHTNKLLGLKIDFYFCPHKAPPPVVCFCRKPHAGLGVLVIEKYKLDPGKCLYVGDQGTDKTLAARCGFRYMDQSEFFRIGG